MLRRARVKFAPLITRQAFTLVELLVVIAIIGLLSTVAVVATNASRVSARNTQRKANLVQVSKALELYYDANGAYPSTGGIDQWQGNCSQYGGFADSGAGAWVPNLQDYMAQLPHDPHTAQANPDSPFATCRNLPNYICYLYTSNSTHYKLIAHCTPEGSWTSSDPFYDPNRPTWAWQVTDDKAATSGW